MGNPEIDIVISKTGKVTVEVKGAKGPRCLEYAELIKEIVGHEESRQLTEEYYAPDGDVRIDTKVRAKSG